MYVYLIMLSISMIFGKLASNAKPYPEVRGSYCMFACLSFLPFALISMFRWHVGTDWVIYDSYFYYINHEIREFSEPLFNLLNRIAYRIMPDSVMLFGLVGFLTILFFFLAIYEQSVMIPFSICLFFLTNKYFTSLNQIRQMLAMSIFVFSIKYIYQRRLIAYEICILVACLIHTSSAMYFPVYFLYDISFREKHLVLMAAIYFLAYPVVKIIAKTLARFTRFAWYFDSLYSGTGFYFLGFLVACLIFTIQFIGLYRIEHCQLGAALEPDIIKKLRFMTVIGLLPCMTLFLSSELPQVSRIAEGFAVVQIFGLPLLVSSEKDKRVRLLYILSIFAIYGGKFIIDIYRNNWNGVLPYQSIFFNR